MKKPVNILIPNVTSATNVGDEAMLEVLIDLLTSKNPDARICVHSAEPESHANAAIHELESTFYYWAVFESTSLIMRLYRMGLLLLLCIGLYFSLRPLIALLFWVSPRMKHIFQAYHTADAIVFVGGGYLRSKPGLSQSLNLLMLLLPFWLAQFSHAQRIVAPISIGPFAAKWQARLTGAILREFDQVAVREKFSHQLVSQYQLKNLLLASDHALLLSSLAGKNTTPKVPVVGFTIREWLDEAGQRNLEQSYVEALTKLASKQKIVFQPIVQVDAPKFGEGDALVTKRVADQLQKNGLVVLPVQFVRTVENAKHVYRSLAMLIGMRMHSNIIAGTQGVPFVPVSYEYKTEGIASDFGLHEYCIKCSAVNSEKLFANVTAVFTQRKHVAAQMTKKLQHIQKKERARWLKIFTV